MQDLKFNVMLILFFQVTFISGLAIFILQGESSTPAFLVTLTLVYFYSSRGVIDSRIPGHPNTRLLLFFKGSRRLPHFWSPKHPSIFILQGESSTPAFLVSQTLVYFYSSRGVVDSPHYTRLFSFLKGSRRLPHFWSPKHSFIFILQGESSTPRITLVYFHSSRGVVDSPHFWSPKHSSIFIPQGESSTPAFLVSQTLVYFYSSRGVVDSRISGHVYTMLFSFLKGSRRLTFCSFFSRLQERFTPFLYRRGHHRSTPHLVLIVSFSLIQVSSFEDSHYLAIIDSRYLIVFF